MNEQLALPLIEKARPQSLNQIVLDDHVRDTVEKLLTDPRGMPHLVFAGPPGTGKTSLARIIAKAVLKEVTDFNYLEINASADRGIANIRDNLQKFVGTSSFLTWGSPDSPFKIVLLDEACSLTGDAQLALRNILQTYASKSRFIFSCNHLNKIHPAILSRALVINFPKLTPEQMFNRAVKFIKDKGLSFTDQQIRDSCNNANGDFRNVYNRLGISNSIDSEVKTIQQFADYLLVDVMLNHQTVKLKEKITTVRPYLQGNLTHFIQYFLDALNSATTIVEPKNLFLIVDRLSKAEAAIKDGASPYLQIYGWISEVLLKQT